MASVSPRRLIPLLAVMGLSVALFTINQVPPVVQAQRPTATSVIEEPSEPGDETPQPPHNAAIAGIVYDYSSGAPAPGVAVILTGGGWGVETVSDSHGNYRFDGLGSGSGVLNLRLPPGAHAVAPDWPVDTRDQTSSHVNLGFYWGDDPPIPVLLAVSAEPQVAAVGSQVAITVRVDNRTPETASGGVVDIRLPSALRAVSVRATQGTVDFAGLRVRVSLGDLPPGTQATIDLQTTVTKLAALGSRGPGLAAPLPQAAAVVRTTFTYDQQMTPQAVLTDIQTVPAGSAAPQTPLIAPAATTVAQATPSLAPTVTLRPSPTGSTGGTPTVAAMASSGTESPTATSTLTPTADSTSLAMPPTGLEEPPYVFPFMWLAAGIVLLGLVILASAVVLVARGQ